MFKELGRSNGLVLTSLVIWALGEGLWFYVRQLLLIDLGATPEQVGLALGAEALVRALLPIPAGMLADRLGSYPVMIAGYLLGIAGLLALTLAPTWQWAIPALGLYATSAFAIPATNAYMLLALPDPEIPGIQDRAVTSVYAAFYAGLIGSPWVGGLLSQYSGSLHTSLWVGLAFFAVSTFILLQAENVRPAKRPLRYSPIALLRNQRFLLYSGFYIMALLTIQIGYPLAPNFVQDVRGLDFSQIGLLLSISSAGTVGLNLLAGRITNKRLRFPLVIGAGWLAMLALWRMPGFGGASLGFALLGAAATGRALASAGIASTVAEDYRGMAFGGLETLFSLMQAIAAASAGLLYDASPSHSLPLIAGLISAPLLIVLWFGLGRTMQSETPQPDQRLEPLGAAKELL